MVVSKLYYFYFKIIRKFFLNLWFHIEHLIFMDKTHKQMLFSVLVKFDEVNWIVRLTILRLSYI